MEIMTIQGMLDSIPIYANELTRRKADITDVEMKHYVDKLKELKEACLQIKNKNIYNDFITIAISNEANKIFKDIFSFIEKVEIRSNHYY